MSDEALREIQLNGKQLVFLFMAATVVAVVIFLCGVMVGRGVRAPISEQVEAASATPADPTLTGDAKPAPGGDDSASAAPSEKPLYPNRFDNQAPPPDTFDEAEDPTSPSVAAASKGARDSRAPKTPAIAANPTPPATSAPSPSKPAVAAPSPAVKAVTSGATAPAPGNPAGTRVAAPTEPTGNGYVVQVAATKQRTEAETIAKRLVNKGYQAYVTTPASGPTMYRVRVGKFSDRKEADRIAGRLQREEQFKPWVTR